MRASDSGYDRIELSEAVRLVRTSVDGHVESLDGGDSRASSDDATNSSGWGDGPPSGRARDASQTAPATKLSVSQLRTVLILCGFLTMLTISAELISPPQRRLLEAIIGSDGGDGVLEEHCKVAAVQSQLAMLQAWQVFLNAIPSELVCCRPRPTSIVEMH